MLLVKYNVHLFKYLPQWSNDRHKYKQMPIAELLRLGRKRWEAESFLLKGRAKERERERERERARSIRETGGVFPLIGGAAAHLATPPPPPPWTPPPPPPRWDRRWPSEAPSGSSADPETLPSPRRVLSSTWRDKRFSFEWSRPFHAG